jgi:hypothetical protein
VPEEATGGAKNARRGEGGEYCAQQPSAADAPEEVGQSGHERVERRAPIHRKDEVPVGEPGQDIASGVDVKGFVKKQRVVAKMIDADEEDQAEQQAEETGFEADVDLHLLTGMTGAP